MLPVALALLLAAAEPTAEAEIVVSGEQVRDENLHEFVRDIGEETDERQLARWDEPLCPWVTGLLGAHNAYIGDTITALADAVGAGASEPDCAINLVVIVNDDPNALIDGLRSRQPLLFESLDPPERDLLARGNAPVRVWSAVEVRGSDGRRLTRTGNEGPRSIGQGFDVSILTGVLPSRVLRSTRVDLATTFIVLDAARLEGLSLQQISAFVSMLALAQLDTREPVEPDNSILNLFHFADSAPEDFTPWDIAYLRALYASDNRRSADAQRGQMARLMREYLAADED